MRLFSRFVLVFILFFFRCFDGMMMTFARRASPFLSRVSFRAHKNMWHILLCCFEKRRTKNDGRAMTTVILASDDITTRPAQRLFLLSSLLTLPLSSSSSVFALAATATATAATATAATATAATTTIARRRGRRVRVRWWWWWWWRWRRRRGRSVRSPLSLLLLLLFQMFPHAVGQSA